MRPTPFRPGTAAASATQSSSRSRQLPKLTLPIPRPDPSIAVPLPLPPPNVVQQPSSSALNSTPLLSDLEKVQRIGSGFGGTVWIVRHRQTNRIYALKVVYGNHVDDVRRHICREIEILCTTNNSFVVRCHGMYDHSGEIQILLEFMDHGSLEGKRITSERTLADVAAQVLQGLAYLHKWKIVHRDIKPSNLLINAKNEVKIADFSVSRILAQTMDCNSAVGTIAYMSPERINTDLNKGSYDGYASDIWSFGVSILEVYLGRFPFGDNSGRQGDWASLVCAICYSNPPEVPTTASWEFRNFIACCLQKEPMKRPTAAMMLQHPFITQIKGVTVSPPVMMVGSSGESDKLYLVPSFTSSCLFVIYIDYDFG